MTDQETRVDDPLRERRGATTAGSDLPTSTVRSEELLRKTLSMLCHFVWHRETRPGDHMWSIPVDQERDFDCILSDAIDELVERRKAGPRMLPVRTRPDFYVTDDSDDDPAVPREAAHADLQAATREACRRAETAQENYTATRAKMQAAEADVLRLRAEIHQVKQENEDLHARMGTMGEPIDSRTAPAVLPGATDVSETT